MTPLSIFDETTRVKLMLDDTFINLCYATWRVDSIFTNRSILKFKFMKIHYTIFLQLYIGGSMKCMHVCVAYLYVNAYITMCNNFYRYQVDYARTFNIYPSFYIYARCYWCGIIRFSDGCSTVDGWDREHSHITDIHCTAHTHYTQIKWSTKLHIVHSRLCDCKLVCQMNQWQWRSLFYLRIQHRTFEMFMSLLKSIIIIPITLSNYV